MQFKVHKRKIYIDTFSDKEVVKYLVQILRKGFWEINIYTGGKEDDVIKSLFFDGIPRYYVLFLDLNRMLWEEEKPNAEFLNPIHSKKDVDNLIQFIQDANAASTRVKYQRQFPDYVVADIHGNIDLIAVSYTHLRAHETVLDLVCRLLLEKKKTLQKKNKHTHHPCNTN